VWPVSLVAGAAETLVAWLGNIARGLFLAAACSASMRAQTTLVVTTADAESRNFLAGVEIRIVQVRRSAITDAFGEARIDRVNEGRYRLEARYVGYQPEAVDLPFRLGDTLRVTFLMKRIPTSLDTTHVRATRVSSRLAEFETRRSLGVGRFLSEAQLDSAADRDLGRLIAERFPGIRVVNGLAGEGTYLFSTRGATSLSKGSCPIQVYVDGTRFGAPREATDLTQFKPQALVGVEFHNETATPAEYRSGNVCGVLLLWSK